MRKLLLSIFVISLFSFPAPAQSLKADSLKALITQMPEDTFRLNSLLELSTVLYRLAPDSALIYAAQARDLANQLNQKEDLAYALKYLGLAYYFKSDFTQVLKSWEQSMEVFRSIPHPLGISNLLSNLGAVYYSKGDDSKALEYYFESLRVAQELGDQHRILTAYVNIGAVYSNDEATQDQALETLSKALATSEALNAQDAIGTTALNLGEVYLKKGEADSALIYFGKSLAAFEKIKGHLSTALNFTGRLTQRKKIMPWQNNSINGLMKMLKPEILKLRWLKH